MGPRGALVRHTDPHRVGHVDDAAVHGVDPVPFGLKLDSLAEVLRDVLKAVPPVGHAAVEVELVAEAVAREGNGTLGVLFLCQAKDVHGEPDLRLCLLLAVVLSAMRVIMTPSGPRMQILKAPPSL